MKLRNLYESCVSNQWFGACLKLPKSRDFIKRGFVASKFQWFTARGGDEHMNHTDSLRSHPLVFVKDVCLAEFLLHFHCSEQQGSPACGVSNASKQ